MAIGGIVAPGRVFIKTFSMMVILTAHIETAWMRMVVIQQIQYIVSILKPSFNVIYLLVMRE